MHGLWLQIRVAATQSDNGWASVQSDTPHTKVRQKKINLIEAITHGLKHNSPYTWSQSQQPWRVHLLMMGLWRPVQNHSNICNGHENDGKVGFNAACTTYEGTKACSDTKGLSPGSFGGIPCTEPCRRAATASMLHTHTHTHTHMLEPCRRAAYMCTRVRTLTIEQKVNST